MDDNSEDRLDARIVDHIDDEQRVVNLWNNGGELVQAGRYAEALSLWEEAVALEELIGHPDLEQDREQLERLRQLTAMSPEELVAAQSAVTQAETAIEAQLAMLPPELRAGVEQQLREFLAMPQDEQEAILSQIQEALNEEDESDLTDVELDVDPNDRPAYLAALWNRGTALIDAGRVPEALPFWEQAVNVAKEINHPQLASAQQALDYLHQALELPDEDEELDEEDELDEDEESGEDYNDVALDDIEETEEDELSTEHRDGLDRRV